MCRLPDKTGKPGLKQTVFALQPSILSGFVCLTKRFSARMLLNLT
jgi:hypothetical protein